MSKTFNALKKLQQDGLFASESGGPTKQAVPSELTIETTTDLSQPSTLASSEPEQPFESATPVETESDSVTAETAADADRSEFVLLVNESPALTPELAAEAAELEALADSPLPLQPAPDRIADALELADVSLIIRPDEPTPRDGVPAEAWDELAALAEVKSLETELRIAERGSAAELSVDSNPADRTDDSADSIHSPHGAIRPAHPASWSEPAPESNTPAANYDPIIPSVDDLIDGFMDEDLGTTLPFVMVPMRSIHRDAGPRVEQHNSATPEPPLPQTISTEPAQRQGWPADMDPIELHEMKIELQKMNPVEQNEGETTIDWPLPEALDNKPARLDEVRSAAPPEPESDIYAEPAQDVHRDADAEIDGHGAAENQLKAIDPLESVAAVEAAAEVESQAPEVRAEVNVPCGGEVKAVDAGMPDEGSPLADLDEPLAPLSLDRARLKMPTFTAGSPGHAVTAGSFEKQLAQWICLPSCTESIQQCVRVIEERFDERLPRVLLLMSTIETTRTADVLGLLAYHLRDLGRKVLLIDANLSCQHMTRGFGGLGQPGLCDVLSGCREPFEIVHPTTASNISYVPTGDDVMGISRDVHLVSESAWVQVIHRWEVEYDHLLIEAGTAESTLLPTLARTSQAAMLVVPYATKDTASLRFSARQLDSLAPVTLGCLLTDFPSMPA